MIRDALSRRTSASAVLSAAAVLLFLGACAETKPKPDGEEKKQTEEQAAAEKRQADEQAAAARRADEERARADEARRQAAEREKKQGELLARLQQIEPSARVEPRGIVLTLPGSVYFDSGHSEVKPSRPRAPRPDRSGAGRRRRRKNPRGRSHRLDRAGQVQHEALRAQGRVRKSHSHQERRFGRPNRDPRLRFDQTDSEQRHARGPESEPPRGGRGSGRRALIHPSAAAVARLFR